MFIVRSVSHYFLFSGFMTRLGLVGPTHFISLSRVCATRFLYNVNEIPNLFVFPKIYEEIKLGLMRLAKAAGEKNCRFIFLKTIAVAVSVFVCVL